MTISDAASKHSLGQDDMFVSNCSLLFGTDAYARVCQRLYSENMTESGEDAAFVEAEEEEESGFGNAGRIMQVTGVPQFLQHHQTLLTFIPLLSSLDVCCRCSGLRGS